MSVSEDMDVAKSFGKDSGIILEIVGGLGFCYWKWYTKQLKKSRKHSDQDLIDALSTEKEWLLSKESKFEIQDVKSIDNYSIIVCSQLQ